MFADPALGEAEFVGPAQRLQIPAMAVAKAAFGGMRGHREQAVLHYCLLRTGCAVKTQGEFPGICSPNRMVAAQLPISYVYAINAARPIVAANIREEPMENQRSSRRLIKLLYRREKFVIDRITRSMRDRDEPVASRHSAFTASGHSVEEQVRKAWRPCPVGLATF